LSEETYQPKSILFRNQDYIQHISAGMGKIDFDMFYGNAFAKDKFIVDFVKETRINIQNKVCKVPDKFTFPHTYAKRLDSIWNGTCYYGISRENGFLRKFLYGVDDPNYNYSWDELIPLPKMRNMIPVGKISDETLWIKIRQSGLFKYYFEGTDYATLVNDGGFIHNMSDGSVPKINESDMYSDTAYTYVMSRRIYDRIMEDLDTFFNENWLHISSEFQKIIDHSGMGLGLEEITDGGNSFITEVD